MAKLKKRLAYLVAALFCISFGFIIGVRYTEQFEETIKAQFSDDVIEVRQGKLAGWAIHSVADVALTEAWEEVTSDIIREVGERLREE